MKSAMGIVVACVLGWAAVASADQEQDLLAVLQSGAPVPQKCSACQKLRVIGTARAVPALAALLGEDRVGHAARYALEGLPFPEAAAALRDALGRTTGLTRAGIIDSLGWLRDAESMSLIVPLLSDRDEAIASAAAGAIGRIGGKGAIAALFAAMDQAVVAARPVIMDSLLQCAERLLADGDKAGAMAAYRTVLDRSDQVQFRLAAWRGVVLSDDSVRADMLIRALSGNDAGLRQVAIGLLDETGDARALKMCRDQWPALPAEVQLSVLETCVARNLDPMAAVNAAAQSAYPKVRVAAWTALGRLDAAAGVAMLAQAASRGDASERAAARESLARINGPGVQEALIAQLVNAEPPVKVEVLAALGERGDKSVAAVLLRYANDRSEPVCLAALESLRKLSVPDAIGPMLQVALESQSDARRQAVMQALRSACRASTDKNQTALQVIGAMKSAQGAARAALLPLLSELGTPDALAVAQAALQDKDPEVVKQAVRTLAQWPSASPAAQLLELARISNDSATAILAVRGCIEVLRQEQDASRRLDMLGQAMAAAKRVDEKKLALGQVGQVPTPAALEVALKHLSDPGLADEAGLAAMGIAERLAAANPKLAQDAAAKVLAVCKDGAIVKRAWALRGGTIAPGGFIRTWVVSGPYRQAGADGALALFDVVFAPEKPDQKVQWKAMPADDNINLMAAFPDATNCAAYARTNVIAPEECAGILLMGSDDGIKAWLNGTVVHANNVDRGQVADQDAAPIKLRKGVNELMLKITQGGGGWSACARIVGVDGRPIPGLRFETPAEK